MAFSFRFFLNNQISPLSLVGTWSPNNLPHGFKSGNLSKIIFKMARNGIDKNIPATPHNAPPSNTTTTEKKALIFTLDDTRNGIRK